MTLTPSAFFVTQAVSYRSHMLLRMGKTLRARRDIYLALLQRQEGPCPELFLEVCTAHYIVLSTAQKYVDHRNFA